MRFLWACALLLGSCALPAGAQGLAPSDMAVRMLAQGIADVIFINNYEEFHDTSTVLESEEDLAKYRSTLYDLAYFPMPRSLTRLPWGAFKAIRAASPDGAPPVKWEIVLSLSSSPKLAVKNDLKDCALVASLAPLAHGSSLFQQVHPDRRMELQDGLLVDAPLGHQGILPDAGPGLGRDPFTAAIEGLNLYSYTIQPGYIDHGRRHPGVPSDKTLPPEIRASLEAHYGPLDRKIEGYNWQHYAAGIGRDHAGVYLGFALKFPDDSLKLHEVERLKDHFRTWRSWWSGRKAFQELFDPSTLKFDEGDLLITGRIYQRSDKPSPFWYLELQHRSPYF